MPLPDYEFSTASYLGEKIPQESFARFITRAARQLERYKSMVVPVANISSSAQVQEILTRAACGAFANGGEAAE